MKTTLHKANTRGAADHGWLKSNHTFSFGSYYNQERMGFGKLRVINDDIVDPSKGFDTHPHQNMEIISIPLSGSLKHKDSEGNEAVIKHGEVQIMSAGTGVYHSEYNNSGTDEVNFLQIWVLPEKMDIHPRYDQKHFKKSQRQNNWQTVVSPLDKNDEGIKVNQQAWFNLVDLNAGSEISYQTKSAKSGVYFFLIDGEIKLAEQTLSTRDALAVEDLPNLSIKANKDSQILAIEVPLI